jgi:teichuronic acid biosynthesis glycosyltransferase TuaG
LVFFGSPSVSGGGKWEIFCCLAQLGRHQNRNFAIGCAMTLSVQTPQITVVMPAYNAAGFIAEAIVSVQAQTRTDWELVIVDDGSTDATVQIAEDFAIQDARIQVLRQQENAGPAAARNRAIAAGHGRYVAFLDADDRWLPEKLSKQIGFMEDRGHAFTFTAYWRVKEEGHRLSAAVQSVTYDQLLKGNVIGCLTAVYDRSVLGTCFMPNLPARQDYGLWLDLLKKTPFAYGLDVPLAEYRVTSESLSSSKILVIKYNWQLLRQVERLSILRSMWSLGHVIFRRLAQAVFGSRPKV